MVAKIKSFIARCIIKLISEENSLMCYRNSTSEINVFIEGSKVFNFQNNRDLIVIGNGTKIRAELLIFANGGKISVGNNVYIGEYSRIWSATEIVIEDNVLISHNVNICDTNSHEIDYILRAQNYEKMLKEGHPKEKGEIKTSKILIKAHAWIGFNSIIHKGVIIGKGAIVSAGSVVIDNVPDFCIVAGNPAKIIKFIK
jgi:acetyltransferase-like isoleucine patch superfamily enzyme